MFNFLFIPAFFLHNVITFGLSNFIKPENAQSLSIITNSFIVSSGCYLFLERQISTNMMMNLFQSTLAFLLNDYMFKKYYGINKDAKLKIVHHLLAGCAIYKFPNIPDVVTTLFLTESSNVPLEIRNICKNINFNRFYIQQFMVALLYFLFLKFRIINPPFDVIFWYQNKTVTRFEVGIFIPMYILWCYWFYKINYVIVKTIKKS